MEKVLTHLACLHKCYTFGPFPQPKRDAIPHSGQTLLRGGRLTQSFLPYPTFTGTSDMVSLPKMSITLTATV